MPFDPQASYYHYRDPALYAELRNIIAKLEMRKVAQSLKDCLCYSVQIDGSADKQQVDSKFLTSKERRNREPCKEFYKQREFVKHFFKQESECL